MSRFLGVSLRPSDSARARSPPAQLDPCPEQSSAPYPAELSSLIAYIYMYTEPRLLALHCLWQDAPGRPKKPVSLRPSHLGYNECPDANDARWFCNLLVKVILVFTDVIRARSVISWTQAVACAPVGTPRGGKLRDCWNRVQIRPQSASLREVGRSRFDFEQMQTLSWALCLLLAHSDVGLLIVFEK